VEKPVKDPAKLPRTEKETEMVSLHDFIRDDDAFSFHSYLDADVDPDLVVPSPPKALDRPEIEQALRQRATVEEAEMLRRLVEVGYSAGGALGRSPSVRSRVSGSFVGKESRSADDGGNVDDKPLPLLPRTPTRRRSTFRPASVRGLPPLRETAPGANQQQNRASSSHLSPSHSSPNFNYASTPSFNSGMLLTPTKSQRRKHAQPSFTDSSASRKTSTTSQTPFFRPSELEDIMRPLREKYIITQTDACVQAKAAYEQLNEQLTQELPQLIDLRYV